MDNRAVTHAVSWKWISRRPVERWLRLHLIGAEPLQAAVDEAAQDMMECAGGKLEEVFRQRLV